MRSEFRVEQCEIEAHAPIGAIALRIGVIFSADLEVARISRPLPAKVRRPGRETNWLGSLLGPVEQYYLLAFESLVNDLHQVLVFERFCEKGESSPVKCGLAH